jgi:hypothetical protein
MMLHEGVPKQKTFHCWYIHAADRTTLEHLPRLARQRLQCAPSRTAQDSSQQLAPLCA